MLVAPNPSSTERFCCYAIDSNTTKLAIPVAFVRKTTGVQRTTPTPALCRLFMEGRCRQGSQCHQIHADVDVVEQLRRAVLAAPPCCQMHTPAVAQTLAGCEPSRFVVLCGEAVPVALFCPTLGLRKALEKQSAGASAKDLCRSHGSGALCRYGDDCNYLHLCKTLTDRFPEAVATKQQPQPTPSETMTAHYPGPQYPAAVHRSSAVAPESSVAAVTALSDRSLHRVFREATVTDGLAVDCSPVPLAMPTFVMSAAMAAESNPASESTNAHAVDEWHSSYDCHRAGRRQSLCNRVHSVLRDSPLMQSNSSYYTGVEEGGLSLVSSPNVSATSSPFKKPCAVPTGRWSHNPYAKHPSESMMSIIV